MEIHIESLITDLAFILLLGAVVTILFKWIKQPVVLGYIVAGFLASPHFAYLPSVTTEANIDFWAQIGIIVLLFSLGLEFSFKKLVNSGGSAVVTALIIITGMTATGYMVGKFLHFNNINCLFLGGMLSMSSTTIILKAFNDMGLRQKKFASQVLAVLIVEDLFAVLMMVLLSSIAVNKSVEGGELLFSVGKLVFFLVIWFLVGVYVLPTLLNRWRRFLNSETLLVVSMGLCLGMAVFSVYCGFSLALGAFVMGSILAGTSYAERIESVTAPVKDLFGAVFFISVGMMVQPAILQQYWLPILILSLVVIVGMIIFGTFGMLVTGQTLKVSMQAGFSLTQIGEFAFIIATLGMSLGVLIPSLYPIVVAVSVITTFLTPYFIKASLPCYNLVQRHLPKRFEFLITRYHTEAKKEEATKNIWASVLKRYIWRTLVYSIVLTAIILASRHWFYPWLRHVLPTHSNLICLAVTLGAMAPFLIAMMLPLTGKASGIPAGASSNIPRIVMSIFRVIVGILFIGYVCNWLYSTIAAALVVVFVLLICILFLSKRVKKRLSAIESNFFNNLNERDLRRSGKNSKVVSDLHQAYMTVGAGCPFVGERIMDSNIRRKYGVNVVSIQRSQSYIPIPDGKTRIFPGDVIGVIGTDEKLEKLLPVVECDLSSAAPVIGEVKLRSILLTDDSPLIDRTPQQVSLRDSYDALVMAVQRGDEFIDSNPQLVFRPGDVVWLVGDKNKIEALR